MMKRITLLFLIMSATMYGYATTWTITNSGFTFSPATITIQLGDDVNFTIASFHQVAEVSQATWNANGNTHLDGGFETDPGGGLVTAAELTVGTHWYVCVPHASQGMKGIIIVENTTATEDIHFPTEVSVYPNPSTGKIQVILDNTEFSKTFDLAVYTLDGKRIYLKPKYEMELINTIDLSNFHKGIYLLKLQDERKTFTTKVIIQ